jgi:signal transduction histidine kinase
VRVLRKDRRISWVRVEGKILTDADGKPYRIVGTVLDFTERRDLEQKREEYLAIASHELRNPLTSLKLALDLLTEMLSEPEPRHLLEKSKEQVRRLITMTGELLNVSKISAGVLDLKPEIINLRQCIEECIATTKAGPGHNIFSLVGNPDINIKADKFRIEQVLVNLLSNASKYSPRGSAITIEVSLTTNCVKVQVIDKGIGIDVDKKSTIFKKFSRIDSGARIEGYGLGLYISDQIIRTHGGQMGVESEKGIGSIFWFTLPR